MANRYQNYQSESQRYGNYRSSDEDDNRSARDYDRDFDRDYGQGRGQRGRRDTSEESGSTGRSAGYAGYGDFGQGDYDQPGAAPTPARTVTGRRVMARAVTVRAITGQGYDAPNYGQERGSSGTEQLTAAATPDRAAPNVMKVFQAGAAAARAGAARAVGAEPYGEGQQYGSPGGYSQGQHRGKGPKGYQRSDERVKEMLCERLHDDPDIDASEVTVNVQGGRISLEGTVDSRRTKNAIEDVAEQIGAQDVQNNLRVQKQSERGGMEASGKSSTSSRSTASTDDGEQAKQKRN